MSDPNWIAKARARDMARRDLPLAYLPDHRPVWEDDLDYRLPERLKVLLGYALLTVIAVGIALVLSLPGQS